MYPCGCCADMARSGQRPAIHTPGAIRSSVWTRSCKARLRVSRAGTDGTRGINQYVLLSHGKRRAQTFPISSSLSRRGRADNAAGALGG